MQVNEAESQRRVFVHEGGYTNHPSDPGGPTNWGVTIFDAQKYAAEFGWLPAGRKVTAADVKAMPKWFAEKVYDAKYWDALRGDELSSGLDYSMYDYGINSGIGRAGKVLRRVVGLPDNDWRVTDEVLRAVAERDAKQLIAALNDERLRFLKSLKTWPVFGKGWERRVVEVRAASLRMATQEISPAPVSTPAPGKGAVPLEAGKRNATAGGITAAGATAAQQAHQSGARPLVVVAIVVMAIALAAAGWWWWHRRQKQLQEN